MHEGHRKRMYEKLVNGDNLYDHEILEIFLFNALPRKNTNPVAHELLKTFGSLSGVLGAKPEELMRVEGVGESVAYYIKCAGECMKRIASKPESVTCIRNYGDVRAFICMRMRGKTEETLEIYFLSKTGAIKRIYSYTSGEVHKVTVPLDKISKDVADGKPYGLLIAHNHLSGEAEPSLADDNFTKSIQLVCSINGVTLYDHCIYVSDDNVYSYFESGRIDRIKRDYTLDSLIKAQDEAKNRNERNDT